MIAAFDVHYPGDGRGAAAAVLFSDYRDAEPASVCSARFCGVADYIAGAFYRRELPCILALFARIGRPVDEIIVDGYVMLGKNRPGLGQHLFDKLGAKTPVIGVAKSMFEGARPVKVFRGGARQPLFVTASGTDVVVAAEKIRFMHGSFRIPTLLKRVDLLARRGVLRMQRAGAPIRFADPDVDFGWDWQPDPL